MNAQSWKTLKIGFRDLESHGNTHFYTWLLSSW